VSYIKANNLDWTYWALNGEDSYGLLDNNYDPTPTLAAKQAELATIESPFTSGGTPPPSSPPPSSPPPTTPPPTTPPPTTPPPTTPPPTTPPPTTPPPTSPPPSGGASCTATVSTQSSWNGGFVDTVTVTADSQPLSSWTVSFRWPGDEQITSEWGANATQSGTSVTLTNVSYDGTLAAGASTSNIGLQGTWSASDALPISVSCS
jgi:cellulase/cellobiase CelA1